MPKIISKIIARYSSCPTRWLIILPKGFNSLLYCDNPDIIKIANCMKEFKLNYCEAGIKILKSYFRNFKLNIILNEL